MGREWEEINKSRINWEGGGEGGGSVKMGKLIIFLKDFLL